MEKIRLGYKQIEAWTKPKVLSRVIWGTQLEQVLSFQYILKNLLTLIKIISFK